MVAADGRQCVVVLVVVADQKARRRLYGAGDRLQTSYDIAAFIVHWNDDVESLQIRQNSSDDAGTVEMTPYIEHRFAFDVGFPIGSMGSTKNQEIAPGNHLVKRSKFGVRRHKRIGG